MPDMPLDAFRAEFFKVLSHPMRIKILRLLRAGEKSVTELQESLELDSSVTSQHLTALRTKNIVVTRKEGTKVFYGVRDNQIFQLLDSAKEMFDRQLFDSRAMLDKLDYEERILSENSVKQS